MRPTTDSGQSHPSRSRNLIIIYLLDCASSDVTYNLKTTFKNKGCFLFKRI
jgi:hypothetical protein